MQRLQTGMAVFGIRGRRVGVVLALHSDCFEVTREREEGGTICLTADSLFTVEPRDGVTLVCENAEIERYRCLAHSD
ncbi:MAG: hypothetical protein ABI577_11605 [bacterium]